MKTNKELEKELNVLLSIPESERDARVQQRISTLLNFLSDPDIDAAQDDLSSNDQDSTAVHALMNDAQSVKNIPNHPQEYRKFKSSETNGSQKLSILELNQFEREFGDQDDGITSSRPVIKFEDSRSLFWQVRHDLNNDLKLVNESDGENVDVDESGDPSPVVFNSDYASHYIIGRFEGTSGVDNLTLSLGKDRIYASDGDDIIDGNEGIDTYVFTAGESLAVNLATGIATSSSTGTDTLSNIENVTGSDGDDHITGDDNDNTLRGGAGADILIGGAGDDWLYGEGGVDTLTGGSGADRFIWTYWDDVSEVDTITDFNAADGDVIDMTDLFYEYWELIEYNFFAQDISEFFRFVDSGADTTLQLDLDGSGPGEDFEDLIFIQGGVGLDAQTLESTGNLMIMPASRHNDVVYDPTYDVSTAKFAIDGGKIIGGSYGQINIYDIANRNESVLVENANFRRDVEAENGLIVVSADRINNGVGAAYVYDLSGNLIYTLSNPSPNTNDYFGYSVDISEDYIIVGAPYDDPTDTNDGSIYIFSTVDGSLLHTINSPEATLSGSRFFGDDVAITDNYAVATVGNNASIAGKSGTIYVYNPSTGGLIYSIDNPNDGDDGSYIGYNVAVNDSYLLVSDVNVQIVGSDYYTAGQVLLYDITDGTLLHTYSDPTPAGSDQFGQSVDLIGDYSVIAQTAAGYGDDYLPAVYVYNNLDGELEAIIRQPVWSELDYSSNRLAVSDTMIVVDSSYADYYSEEAFIYHVDFLENDLLTGTDQRDILVGLDGDDTIYGGAENDSIYGGRGADQLYGGSGDDWFFYDEASLDGSMDVIHDISVLDGDVIDLRFLGFNHNVSASSIEDYLRVEVSGSDLILSYNINGTGLDADYTDLATLKDISQYSLHDLLLYKTLNVDAPEVLIGGIANPSAQAKTNFGVSIDVDDGRIIVSDGGFDDGDGANDGRVYIYDVASSSLLYTYDDTSSATLSLSPATTEVTSSDTYFAISDRYHNSSAGLVNVYNSADGTLAYTLNHPDPTTYDFFGDKTEISDTHLMVSAVKDVGASANSGTVYIFDVTDGSLLHTIDNPTAEANGYFGYSDALALTSNYAVIGNFRDSTAASNSGAVYVYNLSDGSLAYSLTSATGTSYDRFGQALSANNDYLLVSQSRNSEVNLFDIDDGSLIRTMSFDYATYGSSNSLLDLNQDYAFMGYSEGYILISDLTDGSLVDAISFHVNSSYLYAFGESFTVDDQYLVTQYEYNQKTYLLTFEMGDTASDSYNGSTGNDYYIGLGGDDIINGNAGNDLLYGSIGEDVIYGGSGNDHIYGGADSDQLYGGAGADTFYINDTDSADTIQDFNTSDGDVIDFTEILSSYDPLSDAILDFIRLSDSGADSVLYIDANGETGGEDFIAVATIIGGAGLDTLSLVSSGNFVLDTIASEARETYTW